MRRQVVFCTDGIFPHAVGGMQRHSRLLIEHIAKHDLFDIAVIHPHAVKVFDDNLGIAEIAVKGINLERNYLLECYQYSKRVSAVLQKYPDAIIYSQGLSVWHSCSQFKDRLIVNPHGLEPYQALTVKDKLIGLPFRLIFNYIFSNSRYVVSLGGKLTSILQSNIRDIKKLIIIPNAVNSPVTSAIARDRSHKEPVQALFVSRFAHNKGIHVLIDAITWLNKNGYEDKYQFTLVGKGPLYQHYTTDYKLKNVEYLGFVDDETLEEAYAKSDVFVFPTLFEGMPTVVLEAMAKGLPVIVSDTGATAELVDSTNGYLIPKNDVDALVESLVKFWDLSPQERYVLGKTALQKVAHNFTWDKVAAKHVKIFESF